MDLTVNQGNNAEKGKVSIVDRWLHQLYPNLNNEEFTETEIKKLFEAHKEYGNRWVKIASVLDSRSLLVIFIDQII